MAFRYTEGTDLEYNVAEATLVGEIDGFVVSARAGSGGRAGSKQAGAVWYQLANNPLATGVKQTGKNPGGPLPLTKYYLRTHEFKANWIRLIPFDDSSMRGRTGMAIHGRGPEGSNGCIVPSDFHVVQKIYELCANREKKGRPNPTLIVVAVGDISRFINLV